MPKDVQEADDGGDRILEPMCDIILLLAYVRIQHIQWPKVSIPTIVEYKTKTLYIIERFTASGWATSNDSFYASR